MLMVDIYTKVPGEHNYTTSQFDVSDELSIHIQQILMLLKTDTGIVLGDDNFGFNLNALIFEMNLLESDIETAINYQINNYCTLSDKFNTKSKVTFYKGPTQDFGLIDIFIDDQKYIGVLVS